MELNILYKIKHTQKIMLSWLRSLFFFSTLNS